MIDVALFILLIVMAIRINRAVFREAAIFDEFDQPKSVAFAALLYPLAPVALLFGIGRVGSILAIVLASAFLAPGLILSRRRMAAFERSGTDRADLALKASTQAFGTALVGYLCIAFVAIFLMVGYMRSGER